MTADRRVQHPNWNMRQQPAQRLGAVMDYRVFDHDDRVPLRVRQGRTCGSTVASLDVGPCNLPELHEGPHRDVSVSGLVLEQWTKADVNEHGTRYDATAEADCDCECHHCLCDCTAHTCDFCYC